MNFFGQLLTTAINKPPTTEKLSNHRDAISRILGIHTDIFVAVAFSSSYNDAKWLNARSKVRELISNIFVRGVQDIMLVIRKVCKALAGSKEVVIPALAMQKQMWIKTYETLQATDVDGLRTIISVVADASHLDLLNEKPFSPAFHPLKESKEVAKACEEVNDSLVIIHGGFLGAMSKYANAHDSSSVLDLLRCPGVVKNITKLMLSPVGNLQIAAKNLVTQAFDVDVRLECFRALLENLPDASLEGIFDFLEVFIGYSPLIPEACSLSQSLVRCLTDVIEVLCSSHDGLLRSHHFLNPVGRVAPTAELPKLWSLMTRAIAVIFKRTPSWSIYYESEQMIEWMRDALIFGRDMLAQRRVFETAVAHTEQESSSPNVGKLSSVGRTMVGDLQEVLPELARWLRLTDEELLHQSFSLLQSLLDCFRESGIPPSPIGINKLVKHIDDARKGGSSRPQTRLDSSRLAKLEDSLVSFVADDDEVEIISHSIATQRETLTEHKGVKSTTASGKSAPSAYDSKQATTKFPKPSTSRLPTASVQQRQGTKPSLSAPRKFNSIPSVVISVPKRRGTGPKYEGAVVTSPAQESSSDSESDDDVEPLGGIAALAKFQRSPKVKRPAERRQVKILDIPIRKYKSLVNRDSVRNSGLAFRFKPDISPLHRIILSWDYDHKGPEPPVSGTKPLLVHVPDQFTDHIQYCRVFEPLLVLECWAQIVKSKDEATDSYPITITSRQYTDTWLDLEIRITDSVKKDWYLAETDIVLLRDVAREKSVLAKVRSYTARPWAVEAGLRCYFALDTIEPGLHIGSNWRLRKVFR